MRPSATNPSFGTYSTSFPFCNYCQCSALHTHIRSWRKPCSNPLFLLHAGRWGLSTAFSLHKPERYSLNSLTHMSISCSSSRSEGTYRHDTKVPHLPGLQTMIRHPDKEKQVMCMLSINEHVSSAHQGLSRGLGAWAWGLQRRLGA